MNPGPAIPRRRNRFGVAAAVVTLLTGCGQLQGTDYSGEPLFSVQGQLLVDPANAAGASPDYPVRLAILWFPYPAFVSSAGASQAAIVTTDVAYEPRFPLGYRFDLYELPPEEALGDLSLFGAYGRAARGLLVAYQDLNENGTLDVIPPGGAPVDRVLGVSFDPDHVGTDADHYIEYFESAPYYEGPTRGFNLFKNFAPVAPGEPVPIYLFGSRPLDWLVCEEFFTVPNPAPGTACAVESKLRVTGQVGVNTAGGQSLSFATLSVTDGSLPIGSKFLSSASVTVNDQVIPFDGRRGLHLLESPDASFTAPGQPARVRVEAAGFPVLDYTAWIPGELQLLSPSHLAEHSRDAPLEVRWTEAPDASFVRASLTSETRTLSRTTTGSSVVLPPAAPNLLPAGRTLLHVRAHGPLAGVEDGSSVSPSAGVFRALFLR